MNITPLQPSISQAQQTSRAELDPLQDGAMLRRVKDDATVATSSATEKSEEARPSNPNLGHNVDTYA